MASRTLRIRRVYEAKEKADGCRVLVDRLWPRGLTRDKAAIDRWLKELGPSTELRQWFGHRPERWQEFAKRYRRELAGPAARPLLKELATMAAAGPLTLVFSAHDEEHNQAVVIAQVLRARLGRQKRAFLRRAK
jgi:uncharacterized protein YeaO (DUF488 family)